MPSLKYKNGNEYTKIPLYVSLNSDQISYDSSASEHTSGTVGATLSQHSEDIADKISNPESKSDGQVLTYDGTDWVAETCSLNPEVSGTTLQLTKFTASVSGEELIL